MNKLGKRKETEEEEEKEEEAGVPGMNLGVNCEREAVLGRVGRAGSVDFFGVAGP